MPRIFFRAGDWKDRVHVQRVAYTADDGAGNLTVTQTIAKNVPCVVASQGMTETASFSRQGAEESHTVIFPTDPGVRNGDRLLYLSRLLIVGKSKNEFNLDRVWTVTCSEHVA